MMLLNRRMVLTSAGALTGSAALSLAFPGLARAAVGEHMVHTSGPTAAAVNSTVLLGESKALVIDAQFVKPEAEALVAAIEATGRDVETVFITHFHPDHHFGIAVLKARWPEAKVVAHPAVAWVLAKTGQGMFDGRKKAMGDLLPERWAAPEPLAGDALTLEGERFDVLDPMVGDTQLVTPVHAPQLGALVAADVLYNKTHLYLAETTAPEQIAAWRASLDRIEEMDAGVLIPGHRTADAAYDASSITHTRKILDHWEAALAEAKSAEELKEAFMARTGEMPLSFLLDRAYAVAFPQ